LVICHTTALRDQWIEEAEALFDMEIGKIGSGIFDIEDKAIVVANIQSLSKYILQVNKLFGTVILDEAHHVPATTFTEIIDSFYARYRIGLSGTMQRKDGKHVLLTDFFSSEVHKPAVDNTVEPIVRILKPGVFLDPKLAWAQKINALLYDEDYQQFIAKLTAKTIDEGHSVLVIASRIEFLQKVKEYVGETCLLVTGETTLEDRKRASEAIDQGCAKAICGSRQIFSEGISVNRLSAVILAEPMAHDGLVEQIVGRIMRKHPLKPDDPLVYDINFSDQPSRKQNEARMAFYIEKGWRIERY
jgi:superfamily II DNA or RNA helicase